MVKDQLNSSKCDIKAAGYTLVQRGFNNTALNPDWNASKGDYDTTLVSFVTGDDTVNILRLDFLSYNLDPIVTYDVDNNVVCRLSDITTLSCT